jgi:hypothetical protein
MSEYYGVTTPTDDYLAHYGVKGMKWGVRRALATGNAKALARQYSKARRKLDKLNKKSDIKQQKKEMSKAIKRAAIGAGVVGAGLGINIGSKKLFKKDAIKKPITIHENVINEKIIPEKIIRETIIPEKVIKEKYTMWDNVPTQTFNKSTVSGVSSKFKSGTKKANVRNGIGNAAKIASVAALGYTGYNIGKGIASVYRQTSKGHVKAVVKRDDWRNHMLDTFKGTEYSNFPNIQKKKKKR